MSRPIILASTSRYRRLLLERLGLPFSVEDPAVPEHAHAGELPAALARRLAVQKAQAVARRHADAVVIGSDQVASLDARLLGKPGTEERALAQLLACSGKQVEFLTAVAVVSDGGRQQRTDLDHTRVHFRRLSEPAVREYVRREQPLDCAGAFKCEGLGIALFESIHADDPSALIGLPLIRLCTLLEQAGINVLGQA